MINIVIMIVFILSVQGIWASINCLKPEDPYFFLKIFKIAKWIAFSCIWSLSLLILLIYLLFTTTHSEMDKTYFFTQIFPGVCVDKLFLIKHDFLVSVTASYFFPIEN